MEADMHKKHKKKNMDFCILQSDTVTVLTADKTV